MPRAWVRSMRPDAVYEAIAPCTTDIIEVFYEEYMTQSVELDRLLTDPCSIASEHEQSLIADFGFNFVGTHIGESK